MKAEARVDTKGVEEALNKLTGPLKDRLLRSMLVASGKVLRDEAEARVPVKTGRLKSAIYLAHSPERSTGGMQVYHVSWRKAFFGGARHGHLIEFGHWQTHQIVKLANGEWITLEDRPLSTPKWVPAHPFLRPAVEAAAARAVAAGAARGKQRLPELLAEAAADEH